MIRTLKIILLIAIPVIPGRASSWNIDLSENLEAADQLVVYSGMPEFDKTSPLVQAFEQHHFEKILNLCDAVALPARAYAASQNKPLTLSGNFMGGMNNGRWVEVAHYFDYLNNEMSVSSLHAGIGEFLLTEQLANAVGTGLFVMPDARSNAAWSIEEDPRLYSKGTALAYANGAHMHVPWCLYDGSQSGRFYGRPETHQPVFQLVADNPEFFDGYADPLWFELTLPYGDQGVKALHQLEKLLETFTEEGIPVSFLLKDETLINSENGLKAEELKVLDQKRFGKPSLVGSPVASGVWLGHSALPKPPALIYADSSALEEYLMPMVRVAVQPSNYPLTIHIIEQFEPEGELTGELSFLLNNSILGDARIDGFEVITVEGMKEPARATWTMTESGKIRITVSGINTWAVVRVRTKTPALLPHQPLPGMRKFIRQSEIPVMRLIRFDDFWGRPDWVQQLVDGPDDPLLGYGVTRVSWSYDAKPETLNYAKEQGWAFHGTEELLHVHLVAGADSDNLNNVHSGIIDVPVGWPGLATTPGGTPMIIRSDFSPPRYGACFDSEKLHDILLDNCHRWIDMGVAGIQWDDLSGPINRPWRQGGDFSDVSISHFKERLIANGFPGVDSTTSSESLRKRLIKEMEWIGASQLVEASPPGFGPTGWLEIERNENVDSRGIVWVATPSILFGESSQVLTSKIEFKSSGSSLNQILIMDGERTNDLLRLAWSNTHLEANTEEPYSVQWSDGIQPVQTLEIRFDASSKSLSVKTVEGHWSAPITLDSEVFSPGGSISVVYMIDPKTTDFRLYRVDTDPCPPTLFYNR